MTMRNWLWLANACLLLGTGCSGSISNEERTSADGDDVGTLQLSLTGTDSKNQQYRLREATFPIGGTRYDTNEYVNTSVSSEDDPDSPTLRARLIYGYYLISPPAVGWYLERLTEAGAERVEHAILLSQAGQYAYVQQGTVSQVGFQFGVDGELIDFLGGDLEISIGIQNAPDRDAGAPAN
jgi:hypothetical protein